jgi:PhzF family phenazine biosynthesis protein
VTGDSRATPRWIEITQVDALTSTFSGGSPAAVVTEGAEFLSDIQMQAIAGEMNLPKTSFVSVPGSGVTMMKVRIRIA